MCRCIFTSFLIHLILCPIAIGSWWTDSIIPLLEPTDTVFALDFEFHPAKVASNGEHVYAFAYLKYPQQTVLGFEVIYAEWDGTNPPTKTTVASLVVHNEWYKAQAVDLSFTADDEPLIAFGYAHLPDLLGDDVNMNIELAQYSATTTSWSSGLVYQECVEHYGGFLTNYHISDIRTSFSTINTLGMAISLDYLYQECSESPGQTRSKVVYLHDLICHAVVAENDADPPGATYSLQGVEVTSSDIPYVLFSIPGSALRLAIGEPSTCQFGTLSFTEEYVPQGQFGAMDLDSAEVPTIIYSVNSSLRFTQWSSNNWTSPYTISTTSGSTGRLDFAINRNTGSALAIRGTRGWLVGDDYSFSVDCTSSPTSWQDIGTIKSLSSGSHFRKPIVIGIDPRSGDFVTLLRTAGGSPQHAFLCHPPRLAIKVCPPEASPSAILTRLPSTSDFYSPLNRFASQVPSQSTNCSPSNPLTFTRMAGGCYFYNVSAPGFKDKTGVISYADTDGLQILEVELEESTCRGPVSIDAAANGSPWVAFAPILSALVLIALWHLKRLAGTI